MSKGYLDGVGPSSSRMIAYSCQPPSMGTRDNMILITIVAYCCPIELRKVVNLYSALTRCLLLLYVLLVSRLRSFINGGPRATLVPS